MAALILNPAIVGFSVTTAAVGRYIYNYYTNVNNLLHKNMENDTIELDSSITIIETKEVDSDINVGSEKIDTASIVSENNDTGLLDDTGTEKTEQLSEDKLIDNELLIDNLDDTNLEITEQPDKNITIESTGIDIKKSKKSNLEHTNKSKKRVTVIESNNEYFDSLVMEEELLEKKINKRRRHRNRRKK